MTGHEPRKVAGFARAVLWIDGLIGGLCRIGTGVSALAILGCLALVTWSVTLRYLFNAPPAWVDEAVGYLLVGSVMGAVAQALRQGEHICVDILTERLPDGWRDRIAIAGLVAVAVLSAVLLWEARTTVAFSAMIGVRSNGELAMPMHWPQSMMLVGFGLLLLAALSGLLRRAAGLPPLAQGNGHATHAPSAREVAHPRPPRP